MAYTVKLGTFAKKENSTAQPDVSSWAEYSCTLKHGCSLIDPELTLTISEADVVNYNYCYMLGSYYWIRGKVMERNNLCTITLEKDVLASYKQAIGSSSLYILRSSAQSDGSIVDNYYPPTATMLKTSELQDPDTVPYLNFNTGFYLLTVMGSGTSAGGAEVIYQFTPSQFKQLVAKIFDNINGFNLGDAWNAVAKAFGGNPQELISGAIWVPYSFATDGTTISDVVIGSYHTGIAGIIVKKCSIDLAEFTYTVPKHPQAARGSYLNTSPYTYYTLDINCGGMIELDTTKLVDVSSIRVRRCLDIKGQLLTLVDTGAVQNTYLLAKVFGQMGVPISLNGNNSGGSVISGIVSTIGSAAAAIATGGTAAIATAAASGVGTIASAVGGSSSNSSNGAVAGIDKPGRLTSTFYYVTAEDNANNGKPYCVVTTPATLGGYMMAYKAPLSISCTLPELNKIQGFLTGGFYYE